ncbi:hypothetical protein O181_010149 [Austropuccinia psidii MF-1]|uniref:Uncharacterized protein n=1 Tax=Austropuccinia psidii MF-1 TaxID=1389203 RepID=A0A9Q3BS17_9BASI|nr:hypothetical protein [Austropuccinia psidii MF-1]
MYKNTSKAQKPYTPDLPSAIIVLLGRKLVNIQGLDFPTSGAICGVRRMVFLGRSSQFLRPLLLMVLQGIQMRDVARWTNFGGPIPTASRPIYSSSKVPIPRINIQGVVKRLRKIVDSPTNPNAEGSDELDGEEVEVVPNSVSQQSSTSNSQPASRQFQIQVIPSTPRNFQPVFSTIHPPSPIPSSARPALVSPMRQSPIPQPRKSQMVTSQKLQPVASSSRKREDQSPLMFPASQVFRRRECWPICVSREDPNMENNGQDVQDS